MEVLNETTFKAKVFDYDKHQEWKFDGELPVIVDFYADWCGPCRALAPILEDLAQEYKGKIEIYKVDTEQSQELAALFEIRSIPSVLFVPKAGDPAMLAGLLPKSEFKRAIQDILKVADPKEAK